MQSKRSHLPCVSNARPRKAGHGMHLPFGLTRADELVNDALRRIGEVPKLGLPHDERVSPVERVAELKSEHLRPMAIRTRDPLQLSSQGWVCVGVCMCNAPQTRRGLGVRVRVHVHCTANSESDELTISKGACDGERCRSGTNFSCGGSWLCTTA